MVVEVGIEVALVEGVELCRPMTGDTLEAGVEHRAKTLAKALPTDLMPVSFRHARTGADPADSAEDVRRHTDVLAVFAEYDETGVAPRLTILGKPGAGKSFSLRRLAASYAGRALDDTQAPIPLLVELGKWTDAGQPFEAFVQSELRGLGDDLNALVGSGRACLLLDALNEIPTAHQSYKIDWIKPWLADRRLAGLVLSCRERDFVGDLKLDMDTLAIEPLDPPRINLFIRRYLDVIDPVHADELSEVFFWRLATGDDDWAASQAQSAWRQVRQDGSDDFARFWRGGGKRQGEVANTSDAIAAIEKDRRALLWMARNPYLLNILFVLYLEGRLPPHHERRAAVFASFVDDLLLRERERYRKATGEGEPPGQEGLLEALGQLAWDLQTAGIEAGLQSVQTTVLVPKARQSLSQVQMNHAQAASLIEVRGEQVFFTHQLLQEYFAALGLKAEIDAGRLSAQDLWPAENWWERLGWEEVVNTLGGLYIDDPDPLVQWLGDANPEVLADSLVANDIAASQSGLLREKSHQWIHRMTDQVREPDARARAALGLAVGRLELDRRPGVGLDGRGLPDIDWVEIPGGDCLCGEDQKTIALPKLYIARYPITNAQYQAFVDDGGYRDMACWLGLTVGVPHASVWHEPNTPRTDVTWAEAVAYSCWLSAKIGETVRLPTVGEWLRTARGHALLKYPWGNDYFPGRANLEDSHGGSLLNRTSVVGIFPDGSSVDGAMDMLGNVWEWCLTSSCHPDDAIEPKTDYDEDLDEDGLGPDTPGRELLLGASWMEPGGAFPVDGSAAQWGFARERAGTVGFRLVKVSSENDKQERRAPKTPKRKR